MTQNGQGPEPQYPAVPPANNAHGGAQSWDGAWGPAAGQQGGQPLPPAQPLPPEAVPGAADAQPTQYLPPVPAEGPPPPGYGHPGPSADPRAPQPGYGYPAPQTDPRNPQPGYGYPGPQAAPQSPPPGYGYPGPQADFQATQHIPPVTGGTPPAYPGAMPPAPPPGYGYPPPAAGDLQATQHISPVPPQGPAPAGASDATQYIAPVPAREPGERQPPAEFDSLFRTETPRAPQPPRTQAYQQPPAPAPYQQQHQPPHPQQHHQAPPQQQYAYQDAYYDDEPEPPRRKSPVALIAVVVAGCAVVGLGAGVLLSGGDEKTPEKGSQNVAADSAAPTTEAPPAEEKPADPAEPQARELSKLLADSSSSRDTVISSVELIKQCKDLDKAATDLRAAAEQRRSLVTRLQSLGVDKIPDSPALTAALTKAWQASAAADDHYAAWADQMKSKKACKDGKAHSTNRTVEATEKSGEATNAKKKAAGLWNPTADKYGLEKRTYTQL
ncbi:MULTISPECIES: hypothetical protein [unclassified Streptomyces]|uniref:hypothetical protein n=1 Tax=unclassified Streptomyces TaxID=2593676 RepID=UPI00166012E9|nr:MULTISPECIES: hypothetical protein [unclassified Streptomyces]MBD0707223.1 hypothetical protein [Streptomyces sp. CBMA291]MBD0713711.1 hypothetical protein [Streptomyces sp. CBMA370]